MTDEKDQSTPSVDTSEEVKDDKQESQEPESTEAEPKAEEDKGTDIDYKAEAERYKRIAEKKQKALERISQAQAKKQDDGDEHEESSPLDIGEAVGKEVDKFKKELVADYIEEALDSVAGSQDERDLIETIYNNRMTPSGFSKAKILEDMKDAKLLANRKKFEDEVRTTSEAEVKKALAEDKAMHSGGGGSYGRKPPESDEDEFTPEERAMIDKYKKFSQQHVQKR